ncbi:MAG: rRNA methyltransferase [Opitutaceae bacterium]|jgi:23S rRNA (cytidine2498-2'-O)-methyltransferase|nr:rRNA methyltransferase [Opitutaceae bacterium]
MIARSQPGYEDLLRGELARLGAATTESAPGWLRVLHTGDNPPSDLCFAHRLLLNPAEIYAITVNGLAQDLLNFFLETSRDERFDAPWPCLFEAAAVDGLARRAATVDGVFLAQLKKRLSRVARLAVPVVPGTPARVRGFFVFFTDFGRAFVAREILLNGQRRMADDPLAPSRSYLKIEEAFNLLGRAPAPGETVIDLGAAPGGWSYAAAKRGAKVAAIDNGPLKGGALGHPAITHLREDAFAHRPRQAADWLLCDLVEEPHHVLENIVRPWLENRWCRRFVVNLKFGRVDPLALLDTLRAPGGVLGKRAPGTRIRHLHHDREELTLAGELPPA